MSEIGEFHHKDGWYFKRLEDGSVRIRIEDLRGEHIIPPNEWASIVTEVAKFADGVTYGMATRLHAGDSYDRRVATNALEIGPGPKVVVVQNDTIIGRQG